ncbi:MAG: zinc ABC transporter substrate-binding protein [Pseudomonadota bacterium]
MLSIIGLTPFAQADTPKVVVSIKPIHSLVSGVMLGLDKPELLIPASQSPHSFSLRPSDVRKLQTANMIIWVGEDFETPLTHILESSSKHTRVIELMNQPGIQHLPVRKGGVWDKSSHPAAEAESHRHHHDHDPHIWLSINNARFIVNISRDLLAEIDPEHKTKYQKNAQRMLTRLDELDDELHETLSSIREIPYMVFHDAYQFFEQQYDLNTVGSIVISPERQPGARRIHQVHRKLQRLEARCIFSEPQFQPKLLMTLTEGTQVKTGILDPVGAYLPAGPDAYFLLMRNLVDNLVECLGARP